MREMTPGQVADTAPVDGLLYDPDRIRYALDTRGLDALVVTLGPNVRYLTRFTKPGAALAVVTRDDPTRPRLIVPTADLDYLVEDLAADVEPAAWGDFPRFRAEGAALNPRELLIADLHDARWNCDRSTLFATVLSTLGLATATVGLDVPPTTEPGLVAALPGARIESAADLMSRLRMRKTTLEVERLREAARIAEAAIMATVAIAAPGVTQAELATEYRAAVAREGGLVRVDSVSISRSAVFGNANVPTDTLAQGDLIRFDLGAVYRGYHSDLARCFVVGEPSARVSAYQAAVVAGQRAALDALRPGVRTSDLFRIAVDATRTAGIPHYERTHVGHGIGLAGGAYDAPLLAPDDPHMVEEGMVLCVETPYYEFGFGGVQVEDMVCVTAAGWEPLTTLPRELVVLG